MIWIKNKSKIVEIGKVFITSAIAVLMVFCTIKYSKECSDGIISGLSLCVSVLIPSLFMFMIIASYISQNKAIYVISKPFSFLTRHILNLPDVCSSAVILSLIGGYPIGAKSVKSLFDAKLISYDQAKKLSCITICSGPGFVLNYVGQALLNNKQASYILFASQIVAFITVAVLCGKFIKVKNENIENASKKDSITFVDAVTDACKGVINMCALVIAFSALIAILDKVLINYNKLSDFIIMALEVTTACNRLCLKYPPYIISFIIAFGGICVHLQVFSMLKDIKPNMFLFFLFRIIQGIIAGATTYTLLIFFPISVSTFSTIDNADAGISSSVFGGIALMLTAVCFINSVNKETQIRR